MDQKPENNENSLGKLVEQYKKVREECPEEGRHPSLLWRVIIGTFKRINLLDQEFLFQDKMRKALRDIIKDKKLPCSHLKKYSHALKAISKKYSKENTHLLLVAASIILIFSAVGKILTIICAAQLFWFIDILNILMFIFVLAVLIGRFAINETALINEELILLIDEYLDSSTE